MSSIDHDVVETARDDDPPDDAQRASRSKRPQPSDPSRARSSNGDDVAPTTVGDANGDGHNGDRPSGSGTSTGEPAVASPSANGSRASRRRRAARSKPVVVQSEAVSQPDARSGPPTQPVPPVPATGSTETATVQGDPLIAADPPVSPAVARDDRETGDDEPAAPDLPAPISGYEAAENRLAELERRTAVVGAERHLIAPVQRVIGRRPRVRRVTRVIRHVDPWTVFKVAAVFSMVVYGILLTAGVLLWNVAHTTGTIENVERFFESFGWETFELNGGQIYRAAWVAGLFGVVGLTGLAVLGATLFNLITDLVGGVRLTVLEEEVVEKTASPMKRFTVRRADGSRDHLQPPSRSQLSDNPTQPTGSQSIQNLPHP